MALFHGHIIADVAGIRAAKPEIYLGVDKIVELVLKTAS